MRFVKSCKNLFRIFLYVCTLIGLQLDYSTSTEFTPTRIFNRTIQNHKNSLAYEKTYFSHGAIVAVVKYDT